MAILEGKVAINLRPKSSERGAEAFFGVGQGLQLGHVRFRFFLTGVPTMIGARIAWCLRPHYRSSSPAE